jgi:hypothetical protein
VADAPGRTTADRPEHERQPGSNKATVRVCVGRLLDSSTKKSQTLNCFRQNARTKSWARTDRNAPMWPAPDSGLGFPTPSVIRPL